MFQKSRRQSHSLNAAKQRWSNETCASIDDSSFSMMKSKPMKKGHDSDLQHRILQGLMQ